MVASIEESKYLNSYLVDQLFGPLEAHENRMSRFSTQSLEQAFKSNYNILEKNTINSISSSMKRGVYNKKKKVMVIQLKAEEEKEIPNREMQKEIGINALFAKGIGINQNIVILNAKHAKILIIHKKIASIMIRKKIIKLTTLKKQKKIRYFILAC